MMFPMLFRMYLERYIISGAEVEPEDKPLVLFAQVGVQIQIISNFII